MKIGKRLLSLALVSVLLLAAIPTPRVEAATFSDAIGHWAESSIIKMNLKGVLQGTSPGRFDPDRAVSRLELAVMLVRAEGFDQEARASTQAPAGLVGYEQMPSWSWGYLRYAMALGLFDDQDTANFRPNDPALRYQVAVMMVRALGLGSQAAQTTTMPGYTDAASIPGWARGYVTLATSKRLFKGDASRNFRPLSTVTRAEMATLLDRLDRLQDNRLDIADVRGTLSQILPGTPQRLVVKLDDDTMTTLYLSPDAWVMRNGAHASLTSLQVGDRLTLIPDPGGTAMRRPKPSSARLRRGSWRLPSAWRAAPSR